MMKRLLVFTFLILLVIPARGQDVDSLDLIDASDVNLLLEEETNEGKSPVDLSGFEEVDDLQSLKSDIGDVIFDEDKKQKEEKKGEEKAEVSDDDLGPGPEIVIDEKNEIINDEEAVKNKLSDDKTIKEKTVIFDVGNEEKELLQLSSFVEGKIPNKEWDEIAAAAKVDKYVIQEGEWLWKISQNLFGSGFYYSKIWALNPHITNPHEVEPGMTLVFTTGNPDEMPDVKFGSFEEGGLGSGSQKIQPKDYFDYREYGDAVKPPWIDERKKLLEGNIYFQYASEETYDDLVNIGKDYLQDEYQKYDPPVPDIIIKEPGEEYDASGFDKNSKVVFSFKEGFSLNTFVTSNIVQDLGEIVGMGKENLYIQSFDRIYIKFDSSVKVKPGDLFSIYHPGGPVSHKVSDRSGYKYTIAAQAKALRKVNQLWEAEVFDSTGLVRRQDRLTIYTPKITKLVKTFNKRNIEAAIIDSFIPSGGGLSFGDVVYLDRGRADGVEMGNVFEIYSFLDKNTERKLTPDPTYKIGEVTVITLSDNFSTALVSSSREEIPTGSIALTKTEEQAALARTVHDKDLLKGVKDLEGKALDELDVELNLDDLSKDLLDKADQVQLTEDELEELERQEREKSIIKDHERDLKELERLETEIVEAEASLNEAKVDEDKFLEQQNLNDVEKQTKGQDPNAFESLNDLEKEIGLKFLDEDLNSKENPYGLTEFDLEEIDELLNTEKL